MATSNKPNWVQSLIDKITSMFSHEFGQNGFDNVATTAATTGNWTCLKAEGSANAVLASVTCSTGDSLTSYTLKAGDILYGPITAFTLTSGEVNAYRKYKGI